MNGRLAIDSKGGQEIDSSDEEVGRPGRERFGAILEGASNNERRGEAD